jgi:hypothetical protein
MWGSFRIVGTRRATVCFALDRFSPRSRKEITMRITAGAIVSTIVATVLASPVHALEDQASFAKRVAKYATRDPSKPKALCWCKDGFFAAGSGEAGYVVEIVTLGQVGVKCMIPEYSPGVSQPDLVPCAVEWDVLAK